jgi:hypothetical protein
MNLIWPYMQKTAQISNQKCSAYSSSKREYLAAGGVALKTGLSCLKNKILNICCQIML